MFVLKILFCTILLISLSAARKPHPIPPQGNCNQVQQFAGLYEKFFKQVTLHVYPVFSFCTYPNVSEHYQEAMSFWQNATADPICQQMNFKRSKVNTAEILYQQLVSLWTVANCQDCVDRHNETKEFFDLFNGLDECIDEEKTKALSPCGPCGDSYGKVQAMYEQLAKGHKDTICFDVEDRMNQTRHRWSAEFNCCKNKQHSKATFIGAASAFCSIPLVFYVVMYFVTRRKEAIEELVAGVSRETTTSTVEDPQPGSSYGPGNGHLLQGKEDHSDDEMIDEPKLNNFDRVAEMADPKEGQLLDIASNSSGSTLDVNLDHSGKLAAVESEEDDDDVSILGAMKHNVVVEKNLLD